MPLSNALWSFVDANGFLNPCRLFCTAVEAAPGAAAAAAGTGTALPVAFGPVAFFCSEDGSEDAGCKGS